MIKARVEIFLLKQINNNSEDIANKLIYFNNYKESKSNFKNDDNDVVSINKINQDDYDNDYQLYQRIFKNNNWSPSDIIKKNILDTNKYINSKSDKKICEHYNIDTKNKIMNNVDLDIIVDRILKNSDNVELLICDFLLMIYHLKLLKYKNIRLPQKENDNYHPLMIDNNKILSNFITNINWVVKYFQYGSDYEFFNLEFNRYENINKLALLNDIFSKQYDRTSNEFKKLFNYTSHNNMEYNYSNKKIKII